MSNGTPVVKTQKTLHSLVVPVDKRVDDLVALLQEYASVFRDADLKFEVILVLDGMKPAVMDTVRELCRTEDWLRIVRFSRSFGEAAALMAGFGEARGDVVITLPAYWQVKPSEIPKLVAAAEDSDDVIVAVRNPREESAFSKLRRKVFHGLLRLVTSHEYRDLGCSVRLLKRQVADEIPLYGDQHRFLPVLAVHRGFRVREVELPQSSRDRFSGRYNWREYIHRILDLMTVFFVVRFTKKPLRFFGSLGFLSASIGSLFVLILVFQRLILGVALADRPALLLGSLLIVLGVQLFGLGLIGELVIFSHGTDTKEYAVRSIVTGGTRSKPAPANLADEPEPAASSIGTATSAQ